LSIGGLLTGQNPLTIVHLTVNRIFSPCVDRYVAPRAD
ncbi:MAG: hypothetical protein ACI9WS_002068, partial [Paraglaciecola psychrophila]